MELRQGDEVKRWGDGKDGIILLSRHIIHNVISAKHDH